MANKGRVVWLSLVVGALLMAACGTRVDKTAYYESLASTTDALAPSPVASAPTADAAAPPPSVSAATGSATGTGSVAAPGGAAATAPSVDDAQPTTGSATTMPAAATTAQTGNVPTVSDEVVGNTIVIGIHVPITGAAPIPTDFLSTITMIEDYTNTEAPIGGRKIELLVEDDGYDAQVGLAACRRLADSDPLFVIGHTMPAAEDACADYFGSRGIPYFMRGTYPEILDGRPLAWFGTLPDNLQGKLLAEYVLYQLGGVGKKSAIVYQNDQTAARDSFGATIEAGGGTIVAREQSVPRQADYAATVEKLRSSGAEFVLLSMPPVDAIKVTTQAQQTGYHPIWLGGGTWWGYNMVLESAGMAMDGAVVTSPWPTIDSAAAEQYREIARRYQPDKEPQDVGLIMWGWMQLTRAVMEQAGPNLSRQSLVNALQEMQYSAPIWQPISYTPTDHHGADSAAVFRADGQARRWRQVTAFTSSFAP